MGKNSYLVIIAIKCIFEFNSSFNHHINNVLSGFTISNMLIDIIIVYKIKVLIL